MNFLNIPSNLPIPEDDGKCNHLTNLTIPDIVLPNQDGNYLKLKRNDSFRIVLYCYPMTGNPNKPLPPNWNNIPGARGCTPQTCSFRDHYDDLIKNNAIPIGLCTQPVSEIKEMTIRLRIPYDICSDIELKLSKLMNFPLFCIDKAFYIKRLTLVIENSVIKKFFYPIFPSDKHIFEVINWLEKN